MKFFLRLFTFILLSFVFLACVSEIQPINTTISSVAVLQTQRLEVGKSITTIDGIVISANSHSPPHSPIDLYVSKDLPEWVYYHQSEDRLPLESFYSVRTMPNLALGEVVNITIPVDVDRHLPDQRLVYLRYLPNRLLHGGWDLRDRLQENPNSLTKEQLYSWAPIAPYRIDRENRTVTYSLSIGSGDVLNETQGVLYFALPKTPFITNNHR